MIMASAIEKRLQKLEQNNVASTFDLTLPTEEEREWVLSVLLVDCAARAYESVCGSPSEDYQPPDPDDLAKAQAILDRVNAAKTPAQRAAEAASWARDQERLDWRLEKCAREQEEATKLAEVRREAA